MQPLLRGYVLSGPSIHMPCMGESYQFIMTIHSWNSKKCIKILVTKCEGKRLLGRPGILGG